MTSNQRYLAGLLLIQVVLILLFRSPLSSSSGSSETHPLLPQLADIEASRIEFSGKDGATLNVEREDDAWSVVEADRFPADSSKIGDLLSELEDINVRQPVVSSNRYHKVFKVTESENEGRLRIWDDGADDPSVELILGSSSNYLLNHVRVKGDDRVFEVRGLAPHDLRADAGDWVEKALVNMPAERIVGFTLTNPGGSIEMVREDGQWTLVAPVEMAGVPLDQSKVGDLVRTARTLRIESPAGLENQQEQGLADPAATVTLRFAPEDDEADAATEEVVIRVGSRLPDKDTQRYIARSGSGFAATIWESSVKGLIEKAVSELLSPVEESPIDESPIDS